jgi:hypothetical protein
MSCNAVTAVIALDGLPALRLFVIARISSGTLPGVSHVCQSLAYLFAFTSYQQVAIAVPPCRRCRSNARVREITRASNATEVATTEVSRFRVPTKRDCLVTRLRTRIFINS